MTGPTNEALQVFYGTLPLILIVVGVYFREQMLLKDILTRLIRIEGRLDTLVDRLSKVEQRLIALETRAGIVYHGD
jgi:hypothetical protein